MIIMHKTDAWGGGEGGGGTEDKGTPRSEGVGVSKQIVFS